MKPAALLPLLPELAFMHWYEPGDDDAKPGDFLGQMIDRELLRG